MEILSPISLIIKKTNDVNIYVNNNSATSGGKLLLYEYLLNNENYKSEITCMFIIKKLNLELPIMNNTNGNSDSISIGEYIKDINYDYCYNKCLIYLDEPITQYQNFDINSDINYNFIIDNNAYRIYLYLIEKKYNIDFFKVMDIAIKKNNELFFNITLTKYKPTYYHINNILFYKRDTLLDTIIELGYKIQPKFYDVKNEDYNQEKIIDRMDFLIKSAILRNSEESFISTFETLKLDGNLRPMSPNTDRRIKTFEEPYIDLILYKDKIYTNYDFEEIFRTRKYKGIQIEKTLDIWNVIHRATCKRLGILQTDKINLHDEDYIKIYESIFGNIEPNIETLKNIYPELQLFECENENDVLKILYVDACKQDFKNIKILKNN